MIERYCEVNGLLTCRFTEETFEDCDFTDCVLWIAPLPCELDHTL